MVDPKKDFRYVDGDTEVEAFQITPQSRWLNQHWPAWLKVQRGADDTNAVFSKSENPDQLWINLGDSGEYPIPPYSWIIRHADGNMSVCEALAFESFTKVVPVPPPVIHPPADGVPDKPKLAAVEKAPAPGLYAIDGIMHAITLLQADKADEALHHLKGEVWAQVVWCNCVPGSCAGGDLTGCRQNSPLLK